jgi:uncharacterized alkaline shock family protein YloU
MSKGNIHITPFNYEAFYLDYIEGNLSANDQILFEAFLEKHPELVIDNLDLPIISKDDLSIVLPNFDALKQVDLTQDAIDAVNIETFLIFDLENHLSFNKRQELNEFLKRNPQFIALKNDYQQTILPKETFEYKPKNSLKKKAVFSLHWMHYAAAIVIGIIFTVVLNQQENGVKGKTFLSSNIKAKKPKKQKEQIAPFEQKKSNNVNLELKDIQFQKDTHQETKRENEILESNAIDPSQYTASNIDSNIHMKVKTWKELPYQQMNEEIAGIEIPEKNETKEQTLDYALGFSNQPIEPITHELSRIFDQTIDVRTADAQKDNKKGFYVKIGRFEFSHKRSKK